MLCELTKSTTDANENPTSPQNNNTAIPWKFGSVVCEITKSVSDFNTNDVWYTIQLKASYDLWVEECDVRNN